MIKRQRADVLMLEQGLATSIEHARALILRGVVALSPSGQRIDKAGDLYASSSSLMLLEHAQPFVSRGGLKLQAALDAFEISVKDAICLDVGASTGGFTHCLLEYGAQHVYAVDVGYGQIAWPLRQDHRVTVIERCNIRYADPNLLPRKCSVCVIDVSFISLAHIFPVLKKFIQAKAQVVALVKPQFEVERQYVEVGGIVRSESARLQALFRVEELCASVGFSRLQHIVSPVVGSKGNIEYLLGCVACE